MEQTEKKRDFILIGVDTDFLKDFSQRHAF